MHTICTGWWFETLPPGFIKIGVSRGTPRGMNVPNIRELNPGPWFRTTDTETYRRLYLDILARIDPYQIIDRLERLCGDQVPVLCCYEKNNGVDWCHRGYIAEWMTNNTGMVVEELRSPGLTGSMHPMLPAAYRFSPRAVGRERPARSGR